MYVFYLEFKCIMSYNDISKSAYMKFQKNNSFMNNGSNIRIYEILLISAFGISSKLFNNRHNLRLKFLFNFVFSLTLLEN